MNKEDMRRIPERKCHRDVLCVPWVTKSTNAESLTILAVKNCQLVNRIKGLKVHFFSVTSGDIIP